jgi:hypothetical protein
MCNIVKKKGYGTTTTPAPTTPLPTYPLVPVVPPTASPVVTSAPSNAPTTDLPTRSPLTYSPSHSPITITTQNPTSVSNQPTQLPLPSISSTNNNNNNNNSSSSSSTDRTLIIILIVVLVVFSIGCMAMMIYVWKLKHQKLVNNAFFVMYVLVIYYKTVT